MEVVLLLVVAVLATHSNQPLYYAVGFAVATLISSAWVGHSLFQVCLSAVTAVLFAGAFYALVNCLRQQAFLWTTMMACGGMVWKAATLLLGIALFPVF